LPYYKPDRIPCSVEFGQVDYALDGSVETPVIPYAESCVEAGYWEKSDKPFSVEKKAAPQKAAPKKATKKAAPKKATKKATKKAAPKKAAKRA